MIAPRDRTEAPPLVSICVPAYKAEAFLRETLESIRPQTHENWELIVTEDGSRDSTEQIVAAFAATVRQRVVYQRHEVNQGLPATRNTGIEAARSDLIALLDSDDLWTPTHLSDLLALATGAEPFLIHSGSVLFDNDTGSELENRMPGPAEIAALPLSLFQMNYLIQPSSTLLSRSAWKAAGYFDPSFRHVEDWDMWLRCARAGVHIRCTGKLTCRYRKHGTALSNNGGPMSLAAARAVQKHTDWAAIPKGIRSRRIADSWLAAGRIALRGNPTLAKECFAASRRARFSPVALGLGLAASLLALTTRKKP